MTTLLNSLYEEAALIICLLLNPSWRQKHIQQLSPGMLKHPVTALCLSALKSLPENNTITTKLFLEHLVDVCPINEPVSDVIDTTKVFLAVGITTERLDQLATLAQKEPARRSAFINSGAPDWLIQAHTITTRLPDHEFFSEPRDTEFFSQLQSNLKKKLDSFTLERARTAASTLVKNTTVKSSQQNGNRFTHIDRVARPYFFEIVQRWLPDGELESGSEWRALNTYRADRRRGLCVHVGDDDKLGLWCDGSHGHGRGLISLAKYLFNIIGTDAISNIESMLGIKNSTMNDVRFQPLAGTIPLASRTCVIEANEHCPVKVFPCLEEMQRQDLGTLKDGWEYVDLNNQKVTIILKYLSENGEKTYRPISPFRSKNTGGIQWEFKLPPGMLPLYQLPKILANPHAPVLIVEGEKAADAVSVQLPEPWIASTWIGGANGVNKPTLDFEPLRGRRVVLWPDNDDAGLEAMAGVSKRLHGIAAQLSIIQIEDLKRLRGSEIPRKWDAADAISEGWDLAYLGKLLSCKV